MKYPRGIKELIQLQSSTYKFAAPEEWYGWQQDILDWITRTDDKGMYVPSSDRHIMWVYDPKGCGGKTTLMRYILTNLRDAICLSGKVSDMAYAYEGQRVVMFDIARSEREFMEHFYVFAEKLKGGVIFSNKYESGMKTFAPPYVIFFSNFKADETKWTSDRLINVQISEEDVFVNVTTYEYNKFVKRTVMKED